MKCENCGSELRERRENYHYKESGLSFVTLMDVVVRRCAKCGASEVVIPRVADLHRKLAMSLANKKNRLVGEEIKFMRKNLGHSTSDFAEVLGVAVETVSRWENDKLRISKAKESAIRDLIKTGKIVDAYPDDAEPARMAFRTDRQHLWAEATAA